ncbi:MAG: 3-methyl-2-oxobutanoate hydroxymethyltransferase [Anaerolineae bacterium]|nr:3-methyl-2-oxobutanoate hydroxymethyltransferase [Anaerolineae bacterium]
MTTITIHHLCEMKARGVPITMLTAYDYPTAMLIDQTGIEMILVGDSVGMVVHGFENTLPVTLDMMIMHCQAVRRGVNRALLVGDLPFGSYQVSVEKAKRSAIRMLAEGGVDAVKLEGGQPVVETVRALVAMGVAVMGHIGLTPQSVSGLGGFQVQGKSIAAAQQLIDDARALEDAGAFGIVLESIPARLAAHITETVNIPTIGIGAGAGCDGQVLVTHDVLGLYDKFTPKFVRQYAQLADVIRDALSEYRDDVRAREFPVEEHTFSLPDEVWQAVRDYGKEDEGD